MTPQQQAAYSNLQEAKDEATWRDALAAFKATVDGDDPANIPLQALCMALEFMAEVAGNVPIDLSRRARMLLGWS